LAVVVVKPPALVDVMQQNGDPHPKSAQKGSQWLAAASSVPPSTRVKPSGHWNSGELLSSSRQLRLGPDPMFS
jgi:hypothetical protein